MGNFKGFENLVCGISHRQDGQMKLYDNESDHLTKQNRSSFFKNLDIDPGKVVSAGIVNGDQVVEVKQQHQGTLVRGYDGLITNEKGLVLSVTMADCTPVFFYDPIHQAIGLAHAGWRGTRANIVSKLLALMATTYGTSTADVFVHIGPSIKDCHFEVQEDVALEFAHYPDYVKRKEDKIFIDLSGIINRQLLELGVKSGQISLDPECTFCESDKYFSYRREKPEVLQAMIAYLGLK